MVSQLAFYQNLWYFFRLLHDEHNPIWWIHWIAPTAPLLWALSQCYRSDRMCMACRGTRTWSPSQTICRDVWFGLFIWCNCCATIGHFKAKPNLCRSNFFEVYASTTIDRPLRRFCGLSAAHVYTSASVLYVRVYATDDAIKGLHIRALFSTYTRRMCMNYMQIWCKFK
jgi:hypothetical protein